VVSASDALYYETAGQPAQSSIAALEVASHDEALAVATGTVHPLSGAYADAEAKLRALNDLVRSFTLLLPAPGVNVGHVVIARAAIETAARMRWALAAEDDYRERAARWLRERLRSIEEISKYGPNMRRDMESNAAQIRKGAQDAGLSVPGPPPAAIDLVWPLLNSPNLPLQIDGLDKATAMVLFYRSPSAPMHGASHGVARHFADPRSDPSTRATRPEPLEQTILTMAALLNAHASAHGALTTLYGWDPSIPNMANQAAAECLLAAHDHARHPQAEVRNKVSRWGRVARWRRG